VRIAYLVDVHDRFAAVPGALGAIGDVDLQSTLAAAWTLCGTSAD
jgi:hypothetical protein